MTRALVALFLWTFCATTAFAAACEDTTFEGTSYTICTVDLKQDALSLHRVDETGTPYGHFNVLSRDLRARGQELVFAMNAGMYHADRAPVGLYVEAGQAHSPLLTGASRGNFGLLPNGVLCIREGRANVIETRQFARQKPACTHATQSGPMLVIDGALHPRFLPNSTSRHIRNGVGTSRDGRRAVFAISNTAVTFHEFARLFRDTLNLDQALFLDGSVSRLYASTLNRRDPGRRMGPIVAVTR
ncbi:phosphodiester glycosidase family protein [Pseudaestuariivita sp.]|uniref:phosphodiester glycosidase family protein n=1 Tax=Pseudaestuariivita sp. TaxID=2211669 RepID=UPI0040594331